MAALRFLLVFGLSMSFFLVFVFIKYGLYDFAYTIAAVTVVAYSFIFMVLTSREDA